MRIQRTGPWQKSMTGLRQAGARLPRIIKAGTQDEAKFFRGKIVDGIKRQAPGGKRLRPLARSTRLARSLAGFGGARALLRSGDLAGAIQAKRIQGKLFVGVAASARGGDGRSLLMVARIAEFGSKQIVIPITPKMRRFLFASLGGRAGGARAVSRGVIRFRIAARPVFEPVMRRFGQKAKARARMHKRVLDKLPRIFR